MFGTDKYPSTALRDAVEAFSALPGVGSRSALRLALHLLRQPSERIHRFADAVSALAENVHYCRHCMMVCDGDECDICADHSRDHSLICVVESVRDVMSIEGTGQYFGVYHVLGGVISPLEGIGPSDIAVRELVDRVAAGGVSEVIMALRGDVEGDTTSLFIHRQIEGYGVKVTTLARGLGFGDGLEYADPLTLGRSITGRQPLKI